MILNYDKLENYEQSLLEVNKMLLSMQAELTAHQQVTIEVNIANRDAVEKVLLQLAKEQKIIALWQENNCYSE